ncbi:MAG TPA: corrinoid protein [Thermodesulfobacteriota bacterium]|nr:corrinoid protein [Thermodesulfobacteriota bacterium]
MEIIKRIFEGLAEGEADKIEILTQEALRQGLSPEIILRQGLIAGMNTIGERFKCGELFVPEVLLAARAMQAGMNILKPKLVQTGIEPVGKIIIGTVKGDLHDIGKNLVAMMLEGAGFEIIDLGIDTAPERFIQEVKDKKPQIVALSALLTTTLPMMKATIELLKAEGLEGTVKVLVGGAPLSQRYADEIGADGYAPDAVSAVAKARELISLMKIS